MIERAHSANRRLGLETGLGVALILSAAQLVSWGTLYYAFAIVASPITDELGWDAKMVYGGFSMALVIAALAATPIGRTIDRLGGRGVMAGGSLLAAASLLALSQVTGPAGFYLAWAGIGVAMACTLYEPLFAVLLQAFPESYRRLIITVTLVGGFASTLFIPFTQWLISETGWRTALAVLGLVNLALCFPIHFFTIKNPPAMDRAAPGQHGGSRSGRKRALASPVFWCLVVSFLAFYVCFAGLTFHFIPVLKEREVSVERAVWVLSLVGPAQVMARVALLSLGRGLHTSVVGIVVVVSLTIATFLLFLPHLGLHVLLPFIFLYGASNGMMTILKGIVVPDLLWMEGYGEINGMLTLASNLAKAFGPLGFALVWERQGDYALVTVLMAGCALLSTLFFLMALAFAKQASRIN